MNFLTRFTQRFIWAFFIAWRPLSVNLSHFNLLLWKFLVKWNQSLKEWCLDCPLPKFLLSFWNFYKWTSITIRHFDGMGICVCFLEYVYIYCNGDPIIEKELFRGRTFIYVGICPCLFMYMGFKVVFPLLILEELLITTV